MTARPAFSFCLCPDAGLSTDWIEKTLVQSGQVWRKKTYWADEGLSDAFWQDLSVPGLLAEPKALVIRRANALLAEQWRELSQALSGRKQHVWPFFCLEGEWNRGKPALPAVLQKTKCFAFAEKQGWVWRNPGHSRASLRKELEKWLRERNIKAPSTVLDSLCSVLPLNACALQLELEKLGLHLDGRQSLETSDLELFTAHVEIDIFAFLQALQKRKETVRVWTKILQDQAQGGGFLFPFLGLMGSEARTMWQLTGPEAGSVRLPPAIKDNKIRLARALGRQKIIRIFDLLLQAETDVKSGRSDPDQALEILVVNLGRLFA